jgi:hypothetical protein
MGRRSRELRERREGRIQEESKEHGKECRTDTNRPDRIRELEESLQALAGGEGVLWTAPGCPAAVRETNLEDVLAFESVDSGTSLFEGLQDHGVELPPPEKLDESQSRVKVMEVLHALARLRILLMGFEHMTACELYSTLWNQTLWEGCYVEKRDPRALTMIDVSHSLSRSDWMEFLEELKMPGSFQ